jgi:hypothetical protein
MILPLILLVVLQDRPLLRESHRTDIGGGLNIQDICHYQINFDAKLAFLLLLLLILSLFALILQKTFLL